MERLALFPLNTVLFPGMPLPLHIFEERYKLMIDRCIQESAPFGVVLIRSGEDVGGDAEPYDFGTTARIGRFERLPGGGFNLLALGTSRFRIDSLDRSEPYLAGDVELVDDEDAATPEAKAAAERVRGLFAEHFRLVLAVTGQWVDKLETPQTPAGLADYVASQLELPPAAKQRLLEMLSVPDRLRAEIEMLGDSIRTLSERWEERRSERFSGAALN